MEWWNLIYPFIAGVGIGCLIYYIGYTNGYERGEDKGYREALEDMKGNKRGL